MSDLAFRSDYPYPDGGSRSITIGRPFVPNEGFVYLSTEETKKGEYAPSRRTVLHLSDERARLLAEAILTKLGDR